MSLKIIVEIDRLFSSPDETDQLFARMACDDNWGLIKEYIDTVEELNDHNFRLRATATEIAILENRLLLTRKKLNGGS